MDATAYIEAVRQLKSGFVKLLDSMSALCALSSIPVKGQHESELLSSALRVLMQNQDLERCSIFMLENGRLVNRIGMDWADLIGEGPPAGMQRPTATFALGEGLTGLAAASGKLQHSRDCRNDGRFCQKEEEAGAAGPGVGSLISVPIATEEGVVGVLNVSHPHPGFFSESHERTLVVFALFLGQMLLNNRLVHRMEQLVEERTAQLRQALAHAEELKRRYEALSVIDELTGLYNRRFFFPEARAALAGAVRGGQSFSLLLIDIDHFKRINDQFGHAAGDQILCEVSRLMEAQVREGDLLARFGGEEFVVALPETDLNGARMLAQRLRLAVSDKAWVVGGGSIRVSASIGIADTQGREGSDPERMLDRLLDEADQALYFGKQNGRDQEQAFADIACDVSF